ncbi:MAG TPA: hypothetical protein VE573_14000 [Nitrososphaeraceae archaeon]|jgi:hypothetical protein|nr:hypothetical protein [Nitrososphaeraceae archaeon]
MLVNPRLKMRKSVSGALAVAAIILLTVDTINTFTSRGGYGFLGLTDRQSGIYLGLSSIFLFFVSFGFGFRQKTRITTSLLITGGALLAITKIIEPTLGLNLYLAIALPYVYVSLISIGFILLGLGLWRLKMKQ